MFVRIRGLIFVAGAGLGPAAAAQSFPGVEWQDHPAKNKLENSHFCSNFYSQSFLAGKNSVVRTDGVVVVKDGQLIYERYAPKESKQSRPSDYFGRFQRHTPHVLWSASKSVTSAIMGAALQKGMFNGNIKTKLADEENWSPDRKGLWFSNGAREKWRAQFKTKSDSPDLSQAYSDITIEDLLYMQSGLEWDESYSAGLQSSNVVNMVYGEGLGDMTAYTIARPMRSRPGDVWQYTSGNSSILMAMIQRYELGLGKTSEDAQKSAWRLLFDPLQMKNAVFEADDYGVFVGSSYVNLRPVDMAKVGYLYLNNGRWNGQQILPPDWVKRSSDFAPSYLKGETKISDTTNDGVYGMTWWLNKSVKGIPNKPQSEMSNYTQNQKPEPRPYPNLPDDFYGAFGHYGQYIFVVPSWNLIIVRTADDRDPHVFDVDGWVQAAKTCFVENPDLPKR